jgi:3-hydroxyacyl-[acyl-carrier-protein] dehydratase
MAELDIMGIMRVLPHRYPFLLVDRVIEGDDKARIVGLKNVTVNEPFFQGHFPGNPVMPGVLQLEAMAQVGGILMNTLYKADGRIAYFLAVDSARFRRIVRPGDQLRIEVVFQRARLGMCKLHGKITVGEEIACEADIMFGYGDQ